MLQDLTFERLFKGQSPLQGDNRHLHHLLLKISNKKIVWILNLIIIILPFLILQISNNFLFSLLFSLIVYSGLILLLPKKFKLY